MFTDKFPHRFPKKELSPQTNQEGFVPKTEKHTSSPLKKKKTRTRMFRKKKRKKKKLIASKFPLYLFFCLVYGYEFKRVLYWLIMRAGKIIFNEKKKKKLLIAWFFLLCFLLFFLPLSTLLNFRLVRSLYIKNRFLK